jgi:hypothetical protein
VEVLRRVVTPVLDALLQPGELDSVTVQLDAPAGYQPSFRNDAPEIWLTLIARGEEFSYRVAKATFERWDAGDVCSELACALEDWLPGTSFAWAQLRTTPGDLQLPPARRYGVPAGVRVVEVYPDEGVRWPLWDADGNVTPDALGLSQPLSEALAAWNRRANTIFDGPGTQWAAGVAALEPERTRLIAAMRDELGDAVHVPVPAPRPQ